MLLMHSGLAYSASVSRGGDERQPSAVARPTVDSNMLGDHSKTWSQTWPRQLHAGHGKALITGDLAAKSHLRQIWKRMCSSVRRDASKKLRKLEFVLGSTKERREKSSRM